jgi:hypothetical protein
MGCVVEGTGGSALPGFTRMPSGSLRGVVKSSLYCTTWEFGGEEAQEHLRCYQTLGNSAHLRFLSGFSLASPHTIPYTVYAPIHIHPQKPWQARAPSLRQPSAPAKEILAVCHCLHSQPCTPSHMPMLPVLSSHSLGYRHIHTTTAAPTFFAIATPSPSLPWLPSLEHHLATHPAYGTATPCCQKSQGCRKALQHHGEGFGG